jgi:ATP-dependent helicase Lhr and Lhr-like helicase
MALPHFHPAVAAWFESAFAAPTPAQLAAWDAIRSGRHALVAAPTGSGKTLAAFMVAIDDLVRAGLAGELSDETAIVYVSPLKALSNDIRINLELPLAGIRGELARRGLPDVEITSVVRTGDTPQAERALMRRRAPHIVVTTPESLYILLGSESGRKMLASTRSVIVDEIHAVAPNKRGSHLALTLERLESLCQRRLLRIGLSATQRPIDEVARFLVGSRGIYADGQPDCAIVDVGHVRARDLGIVLPAAPLAPLMSNEAWEGVYDQLAELVRRHRTTLVFVNTRRMAERASRHLSERLGKDAVAAHHGSLARELRLDAEQRLKAGQLRVLVATASLELGIDIGDVELVCQLSSPRAIAAFLQRVGRSGHAVGGLPKGRLFPQSRDDLVECVALVDAVRRGELDMLKIPHAPLDVLAQQIVAEVAAAECSEADLFERLRRAYPFASLTRDTYTAIVRMLADGFTTRRGPRAAYLHRDAVNGLLRARRGARLTALTSGGAIPDTADYQVLLEPQAQVVGSVNEDFAVESLAGDVFQLGNTSYRILRVEQGRVRVEDAQGAAPSIPFWLGEAPGRSDELSRSVSRLREEIDWRLGTLPPRTPLQPPDPASNPDPVWEGARSRASGTTYPTTSTTADPRTPAITWLIDELGLEPSGARQLVEYLAAARAALGVLPTQSAPAIERFFDESGGMQLVLHAPFGSRINRAWGLALRKRFCVSFNFELQAAATEDSIVLSLSTSHSFPLDDVTRFLHSNSVREVLVQALLDAPMFGVRWRWNAATALALPRFSGGKKTAPQLQRMRAEDLLATVFPDQVACAENLVGEREIPDHPLVTQTLHDCLNEAMDIDGLIAVLKRAEAGEIRFTCRDLTSPSPLAAEVLTARPYAFLDDAPAEERRTLAVQNRRFDPDNADDYGRLDADAIAAVREEAWPQPRDADELHAALMELGFVTADELADNGWSHLLAELTAQGRATRLFPADSEGEPSPLVAAGHPGESGEAGDARDAGGSRGRDPGRALCSCGRDLGRELCSCGRDPGREPCSCGRDLGREPCSCWRDLGRELCSCGRDLGRELCSCGRDLGRELLESSPPRPLPQPLPSTRSSAPVPQTACIATATPLHITAERLPQFSPLYPHAQLQPPLTAPPEYAATDWTPESALIDLVRARLAGLGPTTVAALAESFARPPAQIEAALLALETEGYVMRGRFTVAATPGSDRSAAPAGKSTDQEEWCERHLLARIHRYTVRRLRREVEPVEPRDFMRFLFQWQHVGAGQQLHGPDALAAVLAQLEGFEAPAAAWEAEILPARVAAYEISWLDELCQAGRIVWTRLRAGPENKGETSAGPVRATPIVLLPRRHLPLWNTLAERARGGTPVLSSRAQRVAEALAAHGALFFDELVDAAHLLQTELENALAELVAVGLVNSDSFIGLRALLLPAARRDSARRRGRRRPVPNGIEHAGRWALTRRAPSAADAATPAATTTSHHRHAPEHLEQLVRTLLRRYGVIGWRLLEREPGWLPPWRELVRVCQRLEARGELRGGRFIAGLAGEQFALPEAVTLLRKVRSLAPEQRLVAVSGADPLNLVGSVLAGQRVPAVIGSRVLYRDGVPIASLVGGSFTPLITMNPADEWTARSTLQRDALHPPEPMTALRASPTTP